jgi:hypothetical protein
MPCSLIIYRFDPDLDMPVLRLPRMGAPALVRKMRTGEEVR